MTTTEEKLEQALARAAMLREALEELHEACCRLTNHRPDPSEKAPYPKAPWPRARAALSATEADVSAWLAERDARHAAELRDAKADRVVLEARWEKAAAELAKVTAERDEALLNCEKIHEEEFLRRAAAGIISREALTPLGKMVVGMRERALAAEAEIAKLMDAMEAAWGIIANASDWDAEYPDWKEAATAWRDKHWHSALDRRKTPSAALEAERERVRAEALKEWNQQEWVERRDARVRAEALEEAAKVLDESIEEPIGAHEAIMIGLAARLRSLASPPAKRETTT